MTARVQADARSPLRRLGALPGWLAAAADPERIRAALVRREPQLAHARVAAKRLRLNRSGAGWTGRYEVIVPGPDGAPRTIGLIGTLHPPTTVPPPDAHPAAPFGSPGWRRVLPELGLDLAGAPAEEADLPALAVLTDPRRARVLLQQQLRAAGGAHADLRLAGCTPHLVRSKPGNRCTILYDLAYPPGGDGPSQVVAKAYRADKGRATWDGMRALWASPLAAGDVVTLAEPLAYLSELGLLLQGRVAEQQTLKQLLRGALAAGTAQALAELDAAMDRTAAGLAAVHTCGVGHGEPVTIADALAELQATLDALARAVPDLAGAATPLLATIQAAATRQAPDPPAPAHGSFRPAQVLLDGDRVAFIDFDDICQAEPALDLAVFLASVKGVGLVEARGATATARAAADRRLPQLERVCARFLDRYRALAPVSTARVAHWEALVLLAELVESWTKVQPAKLAPAMLLLERHLQVSGLAG